MGGDDIVDIKIHSIKHVITHNLQPIHLEAPGNLQPMLQNLLLQL